MGIPRCFGRGAQGGIAPTSHRRAHQRSS